MQNPFLTSIALSRFLTTNQLCALHGLSAQVVRRRIRTYRSQKLIAEPFRLYGSNGRPQDCHVLTQFGYDSLGFKGKRVKRVAQGQHQHLQNWFCISLKLFLDSHSEFTAAVFSATSPLLEPYACKIPHHPGGALSCTFIPDLSLMIRKGKKSLLFFVEIDCGTESLTGQRSISEKIERYRVYRGLNLCKYFEKVFETTFHGFRLLFVAPDKNRLAQLNNVTQSCSPSDFVWVSRINSVIESFGDRIWHRGGTGALSSIFYRNEKV